MGSVVPSKDAGDLRTSYHLKEGWGTLGTIEDQDKIFGVRCSPRFVLVCAFMTSFDFRTSKFHFHFNKLHLPHHTELYHPHDRLQQHQAYYLLPLRKDDYSNIPITIYVRVH